MRHWIVTLSKTMSRRWLACWGRAGIIIWSGRLLPNSHLIEGYGSSALTGRGSQLSPRLPDHLATRHACPTGHAYSTGHACTAGHAYPAGHAMPLRGQNPCRVIVFLCPYLAYEPKLCIFLWFGVIFMHLFNDFQIFKTYFVSQLFV